MIYFITGSKNKFDEISAILPAVEQLNIDLPEIQEVDAREIIKAKLHEALKHKQGEFIVEDTSLYLECTSGLPGPLIKWFLQTIGNDGLVNLTEKLGNKKAIARTIIGYAKNEEEIYFFEGEIVGEIKRPVAESNFGWDPIFVPDGHSKTFAEMSKEEKNEISMRKVAASKLKSFLQDNK